MDGHDVGNHVSNRHTGWFRCMVHCDVDRVRTYMRFRRPCVAHSVRILGGAAYTVLVGSVGAVSKCRFGGFYSFLDFLTTYPALS